MNTDLMKPKQMTKDQLEYIKKEFKGPICTLSATLDLIQMWLR